MSQELIYGVPPLHEQIIRLIFPPKCMVCEELLLEDSPLYICPSCKRSLPRYGRGFVKNSEVKLVDKLFAGFHYKEGIETAIHTMKFNDHPRLVNTMAKLIYQELCQEDTIPYFDCILPIPMFSKKKRKRGYNQTELLAKELALLLGIEVRADLLIKTRTTKPQSRLKREERLENLKDAFSVGNEINYIVGKNILLVDDVVTTGTTLSTCAKILREHDISSIYALVIAIA